MSNVGSDSKLEKIRSYSGLIKEYLSGKISVFVFERLYLDKFKNDQTLWIGNEFEILNGVFSDVDAFCFDPNIRDSQDLDEAELVARLEVAVNKLKELIEAR